MPSFFCPLRRFAVLLLALCACNCGNASSSATGDAGAGDSSITGNDARTDSATPDTGMADAGASDAPGLDGSDGGPIRKTLGMNDVTMLVPLSTATVLLKAIDTAGDGTALVPQALFNQVILNPTMGQNDIFETLDQFQITAVRFDACDRVAPGPCPAGSDGRLRVVFQPIDAMRGALDIALHAFYVIPAASMPAVVAQLRQLSQLQAEPITSPLKVSPALTSNPSGAYATSLRQLLMQHSGTNRLVRLTFLAQPDIISAIGWVVRGVENPGTGFAPMTIPSINATMEMAIFTGIASYDVTPLVDAPAGIALAWQEQSFSAASQAQQAGALAALASILNPLANTPNTVQCMACHTATLVTAVRCADAGVDPLSVPGRYTSAYDLSIDGGLSATDPQFVRGLGWRGMAPLISQRAANETAQALSEIEARYPAP